MKGIFESLRKTRNAVFGQIANILGTGDIVSGIYRFSDQANRASARFVKRRFLGRQSLGGVAYS